VIKIRFQVSTDLTFDKKEERDEVFNYLYSKKNLALTEKGDYLTIENAIDGTFRVSCTYRLEKEADGDEIYEYLGKKKEKARLDKPGHVEKHTCEHDEGKPCHKQIVEKWGKEKLTLETKGG
jgi:hypothetical protein